MNAKKFFIILCFLIFSSSFSFSQTTVSLDLSIFTSIYPTNGNITFNQEELTTKINNILSEEVSIFGSFTLRYYGIPRITTRYNLEELPFFYPLEITLDEAFIYLKNFIFQNLDFIGGKQRIAWGKADKINPTDLLNPSDFTLVTELSKKIPTLAINLKYYFPFIEESGIQIVLEPYANQSVLPLNLLEKKLTEKTKEEMSKKVTSLEIDDIWQKEIVIPNSNITNGIVGIKIFSKVYGFDFSLSTVTRINDIPYVSTTKISNKTTIDLITGQTNTITTYKYYSLNYYRETVIGFDISKDWNILLSWIELAITFPEEIKNTSYSFSEIKLLPLNITTNVTLTEEKTLLKDPYVKFVIGVDKNFGEGWYINLQYAHGIVIERGYEDEKLQDYITFNIDKTLFDDKLKFRLYGVANIDNIINRVKEGNVIENIINNSAILGGFEISYSPIMGVNLKVGITGIDGNGKATLNTYKDYDNLYFQISTSF